MIVFELVHSYYVYENVEVYSLKSLGFFTDIDIAKQAVVFYVQKPGYCDTPYGFVIRPREVVGDIKQGKLYESMVYAHDSSYENYEYTIELGLFGDQKGAENAIQQFRVVNELFYRNSDIEIEEIVNKLNLNQKYNTEGFDVEEILE